MNVVVRDAYTLAARVSAELLSKSVYETCETELPDAENATEGMPSLAASHAAPLRTYASQSR